MTSLLSDIKSVGSKIESGAESAAKDIFADSPFGMAYYWAMGEDNPAVTDVNALGANIPALNTIQTDVKTGFEIGTVAIIAIVGGVAYFAYKNKGTIGNTAMFM